MGSHHQGILLFLTVRCIVLESKCVIPEQYMCNIFSQNGENCQLVMEILKINPIFLSYCMASTLNEIFFFFQPVKILMQGVQYRFPISTLLERIARFSSFGISSFGLPCHMDFMSLNTFCFNIPFSLLNFNIEPIEFIKHIYFLLQLDVLLLLYFCQLHDHCPYEV